MYGFVIAMMGVIIHFVFMGTVEIKSKPSILRNYLHFFRNLYNYDYFSNIYT